MKIVIVSDSHGLRDELMEVKEKHADCDLFLHCGDSELYPNDPALDGFRVVKGNCDYGVDFPEELVVDAGSDRIFIVHGHLHHVKRDLLTLMYKAKETKANIVCFGHTHLLGFEKIEDTLFINPGSIHLPRGRHEQTYVILETEGNQKTIRVMEYGKGELFHEVIK